MTGGGRNPEDVPTPGGAPEDFGGAPDDPLETAFNEFRAAWADGEAPDPEEFCRSRPGISNELRARIEKFLFVAEGLREIGRGQKASPDHEDGENVASGESAATIPKRIGDFRIIRKIGSGGMGTVFEAEQSSLHRRVALKILAPHLSLSDEAVWKFHREAEAGSRPSHPGIVSIIAVGQEGGLHFIAQELVEDGYTLADRIDELKAAGEQPPGYFRKVAQLVADVARALGHAHEAGVVHRDVKPSNILLSASGRPKVSDFGLAKVEDALALSRTGDFSGTPFYMSPEQAASRRIGIDHRTDIFSLGITLYEMITLRLPFDGETSQEVLRRILLHEPRDPRRINPRVPRDLAVICLKALEKQPDKRYSGMNDLAGDLERFLSGDVILARPPTALDRLVRRIRRNKALSAAVAVAAVLLVVLALQTAWSYSRLLEERNLVEQLSDAQLFDRLKETEKDLWPAVPEMTDEMKSWLQDAMDLIAKQENYRQALESLRNRIGKEINSGSGKWEFENPREQWLHDMLAKLVDDINVFQGGSGLMQRVNNRYEFARAVRFESIESKKDEWGRAIESIASRSECPFYKGLKIEPQLGLVPIGRDPDSGLWEFAHIQTGAIPERDLNGRLMIDEESCLVFVLVPGGSFEMGCLDDPSGENLKHSKHAQPVHTVSVKALFLSKFEMSQSQWSKLTGRNPSQGKPGRRLAEVKKIFTLSHPVESITRSDCITWLGRLGLRLPTEAEWEYAARGGTTTAWWTGNEKESLKGAANIADKTCHDSSVMAPEYKYEIWHEDHYEAHAPVTAFRPNPFGLLNICGNVWEWCRDDWHENYVEAPDDGSAWLNGDPGFGVNRGGAWNVSADRCRSSYRRRLMISYPGFAVGVRPARSLDESAEQ